MKSIKHFEATLWVGNNFLCAQPYRMGRDGCFKLMWWRDDKPRFFEDLLKEGFRKSCTRRLLFYILSCSERWCGQGPTFRTSRDGYHQQNSFVLAENRLTRNFGYTVSGIKRVADTERNMYYNERVLMVADIVAERAIPPTFD